MILKSKIVFKASSSFDGYSSNFESSAVSNHRFIEHIPHQEIEEGEILGEWYISLLKW